MGHLVGKDIYKKLVQKIDAQAVRVPLNERIYNIVKALYSAEEAEIYVKMPYGLSTVDRIQKITGMNPARLKNLLEGLSDKGLVIDLFIDGEYNYMPSPIAVGIFEFTMMRTQGDLDMKTWGKLFHHYFEDGSLYKANFSKGEQIGPLRTVPHEESLADHVEILDYERAVHIVESADKVAVGLCSCRHEKHHAGAKECDVPLDTCLSFGMGAEYLTRHNMAGEVSKSALKENMARSREYGLVFQADNVQQGIASICQCCGCCCNLLLGMNKYGYENAVVTSNFIADIEDEKCTGCGKCAKACPINAIEMVADGDPNTKRKKKPEINLELCIGCGVCGLDCKPSACQLIPRKKRVITPETTFERVILQSLERGTLQNQIFDNPENIGNKAMNAILGAFLRLPPVKSALMSDALRSQFLGAMRAGVRLQGKDFLTEM
ncbi:4Fe-4S ferredoxin iron-sulfur binding domain protein [Desulfatibacillum aliphaticivorans]|uniref:4Fe-4S ferredoxin iron-sulfur binding domain protein n=1 Tax=Desulfatibacillum aliphaticivorans TaxID=218208 RepID=B8F8X0_DESAL|nr:4Fe-4S dicluster domain-containing protein [Desulfatibacillum aliphaticivorans]ACL02002.1 4Fe-4S ferredoxin iron-sulfur binding domain protein [Desulfatibacillum aliphaticivorans]